MRIAGLDLETTGLLEPEHRIIEVAVLIYEWDGTALHIQSQYVQRIDPKRNIDPKAQAVHKISNADLIGQPEFRHVAPDLATLLNSCEIVAWHNGNSFDGPFLAKEFERVGVECPDFTPFDTMLEGRWATGMGFVPSLKVLCFACGVEYNPDDAHAAEYDVKKMMECLAYGLKRKVYVLPELA